ncbi:hypothetical protein E4T56_gene17600, partial [Termitomyces sp. T112]
MDDDSKHRVCQCTYARCKDEIISGTERGRMVSSRTWKKHNDMDRTAQVAALVNASQEAALAAHDAELAHAIDNLPIGSLTLHAFAAEPSEGDTRFSRTKKLTFLLKDIENALGSLRAELLVIGNVSTQPDDNILLEKTTSLSHIRQGVIEQRTRLIPMATSKIPAVVESYRAVSAVYDDVFLLLEATTQSWQDALQKRIDDSRATAGNAFDSAAHFFTGFTGVAPVLQAVILMIAVCHVILRFPRRGTYWLFEMCEKILNLVVETVPAASQAFSFLTSGKFPRDIRSAMKSLKLERESEVYATCPACHTIYRALQRGSQGGKNHKGEEEDIPDSIPVYPQRCTAKRHGHKCKELLVRPKSIGERKLTIFVPVRPYVVFDFKDWLAGLLSREGYEQKMDKAWEKMVVPVDGKITDIFQGSAIRDFKGPDGKTHFSACGGNSAGRYLFSLGIDFFNPLGNKQAGKKISVGMISVACLNLPIEERHKPENLFVQLIPGPREPPVEVDGLNPYLEPVVNAFLELWTGVFFSRTAEYLYGRAVFCAVLLVICDLPMACKVGGFTAISHEKFCSRCECSRSVHGYKDYNYDFWVPHTDVECREQAKKYFNASSPEEAQDIVNSSGVRWTELLRLPYYKQSSSLVVDVMHNLFLGLIKEHFRSILGYDEGKTKKGQDRGKPTKGLVVKIHFSADNPQPENKTHTKDVRTLVKWLLQPMEINERGQEFEDAVKKWSKVSLPALRCVAKGLDGCEAYTSPTRLVREHYARAIVTWRLKQIADDDIWQPGSVLTDEEMKTIAEDLEYVVKPSWMPSVPLLSGSKLKADEWRTLGCLNLPMSLIRLWSKHLEQDRLHFLRLTMSLMSAVLLATSRVTSEEHCARYLKFMVEYRKELRQLFPLYDCVPNHHVVFHIPEFIRLFGPVHGWWAFPFERAIGQLQRLSTNYNKHELCPNSLGNSSTLTKNSDERFAVRAWDIRGCDKTLCYLSIKETSFHKCCRSHVLLLMPAYRTDQLCTPPQGSSALKPMQSRRKRTVTPWSRIASGPHDAASLHGISPTDAQIRTEPLLENHIHSADDLSEWRIQSSNVNTLEGGHQRVTEDLENKKQMRVRGVQELDGGRGGGEEEEGLKSDFGAKWSAKIAFFGLREAGRGHLGALWGSRGVQELDGGRGGGEVEEDLKSDFGAEWSAKIAFSSLIEAGRGHLGALWGSWGVQELDGGRG